MSPYAALPGCFRSKLGNEIPKRKFRWRRAWRIFRDITKPPREWIAPGREDLLPDRILDGTPESVALRSFASDHKFYPLRMTLFQYAAVFDAELPKYVILLERSPRKRRRKTRCQVSFRPGSLWCEGLSGWSSSAWLLWNPQARRLPCVLFSWNGKSCPAAPTQLSFSKSTHHR